MPDQLDLSSVNPPRRSFLARAGVIGAAVSAGLLGSAPKRGQAAQHGAFQEPNGHRLQITDNDILNFALQFEYLGAEFYLRATTGSGLSDADITGAVGDNEGIETARDNERTESNTPEAVTGGAKINFQVAAIAGYANQLAADELAHVRFVRSNIPAKDVVARPAIDFTNAFTAAAVAAGVIASGQSFDPFSSDDTSCSARTCSKTSVSRPSAALPPT